MRTDIGFRMKRTTFRQSLAIQRRVIGALLMREVITRFGRHNLGVLWLFLEPMLFTIGVASLWTAAGLHQGSPIPIFAFAVTGYSSVLMWRNAVNRCNFAIQQNLNLLYHRNVQVIDVLITRIAIEVVGATASFIVLSVILISVDAMSPPVDLFEVLVGWLMLAWFGSSLALTIGALSAYSALVDRLWHPASYLLFPLSGAAFMVDWLSPGFQKAVMVLPMVHGVEMLREGYFGNVVHTHYDLGYMATCCLVLTLVGFFLTRDAAGRTEVE
jgi:ABC-type polysaccharide/polyol phosphate export permease